MIDLLCQASFTSDIFLLMTKDTIFVSYGSNERNLVAVYKEVPLYGVGHKLVLP